MANKKPTLGSAPFSPTQAVIDFFTPTQEQMKSFTSPSPTVLAKKSRAARTAGGLGGGSLASGAMASITNGEVNKFANNANDAALAGDMVNQANGKPTLAGPIPQRQPEDVVSQALNPSAAPNPEAAKLGVANQLDPNRIGARELRPGEGIVDVGGRRVYEVQNGVVTKFDAQGNVVPVKQIGSISSGPAVSSPAAEATQQASPAVQTPVFQAKSGPSDYEMRLAARNAAVGGSDMRAKAEYKNLLAQKAAIDEYNKTILGVNAAIAGKQIEAGAHRYAADQARIGETGKAQAAFGKALYDAAKDKAELSLKERELNQKEKGQLGQQNIDIGKLNEMYDTSISKATMESPDSVAGLHQGRAASLLTATGGDVEKAIKADPQAMSILSSNMPAQQKIEQLKALHPAYANYLLRK